MTQKLLVDIGGTLELKYFSNSIQQIPSSALITIYDDGGAVKVAEIAVSDISAIGTMTYIVLPAIVDNVYYNWKAIWKFVVGANTFYRSSLFYVVRQILENPVVDSDIINAAPFVKEKNYSKVITADSGSATEIVSTELNEDDDYWNGGIAKVAGGTNIGESRKITDFVKASNRLTTEEFTAAIDTTSIIVVIRTFKKEIDNAFKKFELDMKNSGNYIDRIIDNEQVRQYILILSLYYICDNFSTNPLDKWDASAVSYLKEYKDLMRVAVFDYDENDNGNIESDESKDSIMQSEGVR